MGSICLNNTIYSKFSSSNIYMVAVISVGFFVVASIVCGGSHVVPL